MKICIVSSPDEETIQGEETFQGRKLYEEIRYTKKMWNQKTIVIRVFHKS